MSVWLLILIAAVVGLIAAGITYFVTADGLGGEIALSSVAFILIGGLTFAIPMAIRADHDYQRWCAAQGGHTTSHTDTVSTVGGDGKVGVGTSTTTYCLSADGRIIDIQ
jgi:hypothetical protein